MKTFKEFYTLPFNNQYGNVFTKENQLVFQFEETLTKFENKFISALNSNTELEGYKDTTFTYSDSYIYIGEKIIISIRGWGALTSPSCEGLTKDQAIKVQNEFGNWLVSRLNGKGDEE